MSNVCKCPKPPGGSITCSDDQLAVCGYQDGEIVSGCFDRPGHLESISDSHQRNLALGNWVLSTITGVVRTDSDPIDPNLAAMLRSGQYMNERTGEVLKFSVPRDLDLQSVAQSKPLARVH
jgi:hypothetical protein